MTKGLVLARSFKRAGHRVIGADFGSFSPGRVSNALDAFYPLQKPTPKAGSGPYVQSLLDIVTREHIELWVSCSGVASAVEDGEAKEVLESRTSCRAIQFDIATTQTLHEKHTFIQHTKEIGLTVPETHTIQSRPDVDDVLRKAPPGRKYIMKPIGMDDSVRGDMTLLPKPSAEETAAHLDKLRISKRSSYILQQFISGKEYCTHALIVEGKVKVFVACPSSELLMYYEALPDDSALSRAMLRFTEEYSAKGGAGFTGHLSFDFLVEDPCPKNWKDIVLYPIECNPRAHTAVALFGNTPAMAGAYLSFLPHSNGTAQKLVITPLMPKRYYWIGHDLITLVLLPLLHLATNQISFQKCISSVAESLVHVLTWTDGTFDIQDPLPWWWLYYVYWPMQFLACLEQNRRWSRINVSTLKMFEI